MASSGYTAITFVANEQPTTAKWNLIGSNDASFNNGNGFEDSIIVARHMAAASVGNAALKTDAITLGYAEVTTNQGGIVAEVPLTGLSVTVTIPSGGRRVEIIGCIGFLNGTVPGDRASLATKDGATTLNYSTRIVTGLGQAHYTIYSYVPTAGTHTYSLALAREIGTGSVATNSNSSSPSFILVRLI